MADPGRPWDACPATRGTGPCDCKPADATPEEIMQGIAKAITAKDFPAVVALLKLLAVKDPCQAEVVYTSMLAVLDAR